jgi:hypothetical protein
MDPIRKNDNKNPGHKFKQIKKIEPARPKASSAACGASSEAGQDKPPC